MDVVAIMEWVFGVKYSLGGAYGLLDRLGYSCLTPRPLHEKANRAAAEDFKRRAPFCRRGEASRPPPGRQAPRLALRRGAIRAAGDHDRRLGPHRLAAAGGAADALRVGVAVRRGRAGHGRVGGTSAAAARNASKECSVRASQHSCAGQRSRTQGTCLRPRARQARLSLLLLGLSLRTPNQPSRHLLRFQQVGTKRRLPRPGPHRPPCRSASQTSGCPRRRRKLSPVRR